MSQGKSADTSSAPFDLSSLVNFNFSCDPLKSALEYLSRQTERQEHFLTQLKRRIDKTVPDAKDLVNNILKETQLGVSPEETQAMITEAVEKRIGEYRDKEVKEDIQREYQTIIFMIGERLRGLEEWREDRMRWEEKERGRRDAMETRMDEFGEDIAMLKKGRNDAYSQMSIIREDVGKIMDRVKVVEYIQHKQKSTANRQEDEDED